MLARGEPFKTAVGVQGPIDDRGSTRIVITNESSHPFVELDFQRMTALAELAEVSIFNAERWPRNPPKSSSFIYHAVDPG